MKTYGWSVFVCLVWMSQAMTPQEQGLAIATENDRINNGFRTEKAEMEMVLINAHGDQTIRKLSNMIQELKGDGDQSLTLFHWPADVKGTKMLTWSHKTGDDDQWLFLPALKRVKRISSRNKSGAFMGSEFSYEDLGSQEVEEFQHRLLEEGTWQKREIWKLERVPVNPKSGYSKEIAYVDKEYRNPLRIEYYDRKGELLKVATFKGYEKMDRWWKFSTIEMKNIQTQKESVLTWKNRVLGTDIDPAQFESDTMAD